MPTLRAVTSWAVRHPEFANKYYDAWRSRAWRWADEIVEIVDGIPVDADMARVQRERTRYDARRWMLSKLLPEFADKIEHSHQHSGHVQVILPHNQRTPDGVLLEGQSVELIEDGTEGNA
jgi:hypothetical protein